MNDNKTTADEGVMIGRNHWDVPVCVELRAFLGFGRRMDGLLRRLVTRWAHAASPQARALTTQPQETSIKCDGR
jgi:hypothetical protein